MDPRLWYPPSGFDAWGSTPGHCRFYIWAAASQTTSSRGPFSGSLKIPGRGLRSGGLVGPQMWSGYWVSKKKKVRKPEDLSKENIVLEEFARDRQKGQSQQGRS
ncbi:unnamed protein product [Microthlaspi erraticum]|uniref:Uncharacterized protein n=1 Tax=Microthlaspi erraticum TaxID=1685480 RepID=A0A6D2IQP6_9BRAS|nr:unnamed protein product [Microthlaspi erraticum]